MPLASAAANSSVTPSSVTNSEPGKPPSTASVPSPAPNTPASHAGATATITFTDDSGNFSYSLVDTTSALPTVNGTGTLVAGQPISLNGFALRLTGLPKSGDTLTVARTAFPAGDNGNANALLALRDATFVGEARRVPRRYRESLPVTVALSARHRLRRRRRSSPGRGGLGGGG